MYRGVASRGSMLFFMLNSLGRMHAFYQYSLQAFVVSPRAGCTGTEDADWPPCLPSHLLGLSAR